MSLPTSLLLSDQDDSLPRYIIKDVSALGGVHTLKLFNTEVKDVTNMLETVHPSFNKPLWMVWARHLYCRGAISSPNFTTIDQFLISNEEGLIRTTYFLEKHLKDQTQRIKELRTLFCNILRMPEPSSV